MLPNTIRILTGLLFLLLATGVFAVRYTISPDQAIARATGWPTQITISQTAVNKSHYWQTASHFEQKARSNATYWTAQPTPYPNMLFHLDNGLWLARFYALTGNTTDGDLAAKCVRDARKCWDLYLANPAQYGNCSVSAETTRMCYWIDQYMANCPSYSNQHRQWIRDLALAQFPSYAGNVGWAKERGSFNRAFACALNAECLLKLVPDAPDADLWRTYIEEIWDYWWTYKDNDEGTDHYNSLWFRYLLEWIQIRNFQTEFWSSPGVKRMMDRYLYHVTPMGAYPHYGDSTGWNVSWGHYAYLFEACATHYRDGQYKWAAHRIYDYGINRIENIDSWSYTGSEAAWSLLNAWALADDTIAEVPRTKDMALLLRKKCVMLSPAEIAATGLRYFDMYQELMPDKMIFSSGTNRDSMFLMVDASGDTGHNHEQHPTLFTLTDRQSVLLMSLGYMERAHEDHDRALLMDFSGYHYDSTYYWQKSTADKLLAVDMYDLGNTGYGREKIGTYQGYPATLDRDIFFIKGIGAIIKDTVAFDAQLTAPQLPVRWGQLYRVANLGPDYGPNWINTYTGEWLPIRGIGANTTVNARFRNSKRDLLIYFLPAPQGAMEIVDHKQWDSTNPLPWRVQYSNRLSLAPNVPASAVTLLLSHASGGAQSLADGVRVYHDDAQYTIFEFLDAGNALHSLVLNQSGGPVTGGGLETDGQVAYVKRTNNQVVDVALQGGTYVRVNGQDVAALAAPARTVIVPEPISAVQVAASPANLCQLGNTVRLTASSTGGTMVQYRFQAGYEDGNGEWQWPDTRAYSTDPVWNWRPSIAEQYTIRVWAKEGDSTQEYDVTADLSPYTVNAPPTVSITAPSPNAVINGAIAIAADAADTDGTVTKVEFYADSNKIGEDATAPYTCNWTTATSGAHSLLARATDNRGALVYSAAVPITVNAAPTVQLISPLDGLVLSNSIHLVAKATDGDGTIAKVEFFAGDTMISESLTAPYVYDWATPPAATHILTARATDNSGGVATSAPVTVRINAVPTLEFTFPTDGAVFVAPNNLTLTVDAVDPDGTLTKVDYSDGQAMKGRVTRPPYSYFWYYPFVGTHTLTASTIDNDGATATATPVNITVWGSQDIGIVGKVGNASYTAPTFTVTGAGSGVGGRADAYRLVYLPLTGNCTMVARLTGFNGTSSNARAGIVIRQSLDVNALEAALLYSPTAKKVIFFRRTNLRGSTAATATASSLPRWLKITRSGNTIRAYQSTNGTTWTAVGSAATVGFTGTIYVGLEANSGTTTAVKTATFDNVSITPGVQ